MDFDADLTQIQGALLNIHNSHNFQNFIYWDDKKTIINNIVLTFKNILSDKGYLLENSVNLHHKDNLKKITMFFILNADLRTIDDLVDNDDIGHLVKKAPIIPKYLLLSFVFGLHLEEFYCEAIKNCYPKLSLELSRIATQNITETTPEESIKIAKILILSIYGATVKLFHKKEGLHKYILNGYYESIFELLKYYNDPPNKKQMAFWKTNQWYIHSAKTLCSLFELMITSFNMFLKKSYRSAFKDTEIYSYTYVKSPRDSASDSSETVNNNIQLFLLKYNHLFIETMKDLLMLVNIDTYCAWSEFDSHVDSSRTLQKDVGELAYNLHSIMTNRKNDLNDESVSLLVPIMSKPLEIADIIKQSDRAAILKKANETSKNQMQWLTALFNDELFFTDNAYIQCLVSNLDVLTEIERFEIFKKCVVEYYKMTTYEHIENMKNLIFTCFSKFSIDYKRKSLISAFANNPLSNKFELKNFDAKCTEVFNKFVEINESITSDFLDLFIQNPFKFFIHIFDRCIKNSQAINLLDLMHIFEGMDLLNYGDFHPDCKIVKNQDGIKIFSELQVVLLLSLRNVEIQYSENSLESKGLITLVQELIDKNVLPDVVVIFKYIMDQIDKLLADKDFQRCLVFLKCLSCVFVADKFQKYIALMIVRIAQIMEIARWSISTYTMASVEVLDIVITFEYFLISEFQKICSLEGDDYKWLILKLGFLTPLNMIHFKELLPVHICKPLLDGVRNYRDLSVSLCYLIPRCTIYEWKILYENLITTEDPVDTFRIFCDTVAFVTSSAVKINTVKSYGCLENCCRNLATVLQDCILPLNEHDDRQRLTKEIIYLINILPVTDEPTYFNIFLTPLSNLICLYVKNNSAEGVQQKFQMITIIEKLSNEYFRNIIKKLFEK